MNDIQRGLKILLVAAVVLATELVALTLIGVVVGVDCVSIECKSRLEFRLAKHDELACVQKLDEAGKELDQNV